MKRLVLLLRRHGRPTLGLSISLCLCLVCCSQLRGMCSQARDASIAPDAIGMTATGIQNFIDPLVLEQLERRKIAGAVVVVVKDGAVILSKGYGHADVAAGRAMGPAYDRQDRLNNQDIHSLGRDAVGRTGQAGPRP